MSVNVNDATDWLKANEIINTALVEWFGYCRRGDCLISFAESIQARLAHAGLGVCKFEDMKFEEQNDDPSGEHR